MFTGIIEHTGTIDKAEHLATLCLRAIEHDASLAELLSTLDAIDA